MIEDIKDIRIELDQIDKDFKKYIIPLDTEVREDVFNDLMYLKWFKNSYDKRDMIMFDFEVKKDFEKEFYEHTSGAGIKFKRYVKLELNIIYSIDRHRIKFTRNIFKNNMLDLDVISQVK